MFKKILNVAVMLAFLVGASGLTPSIVVAAQFTGVKDTLSTVQTSATATHVITATLVGGDTFAAGETMTYNFTDADFTLNAIGSWQTADFTFNDGGARTVIAVSSVSGTPPTCTAGTSNVGITINTTTSDFVVTACSTYTPSSANATLTFTINGTTSAGTGTMTNKATDVESSVYTITESNTDTATGAVVAEADAVVTVTGTVTPTLTFDVSQNAVSFGTLTSANARFATTSGGAAGPTPTLAHTISVGTNASAGYGVTYLSPATLTSGTGATIAGATVTGDQDGAPASAQFAMGVATSSGSPTIVTTYNQGSNNYNYAAAAVTALFSASAPASDVVNSYYLANIPATQSAGTYSSTFTYVATGNF